MQSLCQASVENATYGACDPWLVMLSIMLVPKRWKGMIFPWCAEPRCDVKSVATALQTLAATVIVVPTCTILCCWLIVRLIWTPIAGLTRRHKMRRRRRRRFFTHWVPSAQPPNASCVSSNRPLRPQLQSEAQVTAAHERRFRCTDG